MKSWYRFENSDKASKIYIYDEIGRYDVSVRDFVADLEDAKNEIELHLNSPGGDVFEGFAIYNAIQTSEKKVNVYIDGLAASIASVVAMAGEKIFISKNAQIMIHNVSAGVYGNTKKFEKTLELLELLETQIIDIYANKTGLPPDEIKDMMDEETWMPGNIAVEKGFADEIVGAKTIKNEYSLKVFNYYKKQPENIKKEVAMDEKLKNKLVETEAVVSKQKETLAALENKTSELEAKLAEYRTKEIKNTVEKAITDGKLLPVQKEWATNLATKDVESFQDYLKTVNNKSIKFENIETGSDQKVTFLDLLKDPARAEILKKESPEEYKKLYDKYIMEGK